MRQLIILILAMILVKTAHAQEICNVPILSTVAPVVYENDASLYLSFDGNFEYDVYLVETPSGLYSQSAQTSNGAIEFTNLNLESDFEIYSYDDCGQAQMLDIVSMDIKSEEVISISNQMFTTLRNWIDNYSQTSLNDYLEADESTSLLEKSYLIQSYLYDGAPLPDSYKTGSFGDDPGGEEKPCQCKIFNNHRQNLFPKGISPNGMAEPKVERFGGYWGGEDYWDYTGSITGAAKNERLYSRGKRTTRKTINIKTADTLQSPSFGILRYLMLCSNELGKAEDCMCEKDFKLEYAYDSRVFTHSQTPTCTWCGSKGASSYAEDMAVLISFDHQGLPSVLDAGSISAASECNHDYEREWFINLVDVAKNITGAYFGIKGLDSLARDTSGLNSLKVLSDAVFDGITSIISTSPIKKTGCSSGVATGRVIAGQKILTLKVNEALDIFLYSFSSLAASGYTSFVNKAKIQSDFYMAGMIYEGFGTPPVESCCLPFFGNWSMADAEDSPFPLNNLNEMAGSFLAGGAPASVPRDPFHGGIEVEGNYGKINGELPSFCQGSPFGSLNKIDFNYIENNVLEVISKKSPMIRYSIIDPLGRVIEHRMINQSNLNYNLSDLPKMAYCIFRVETRDSYETQKIILK